MQRFELSDGKSHKFWEIAQSGASITVRFGRIGTDGQTLTKKLASPDAAQREHDKLVAEKTKKGYAPIGAAAKTKAAPAAKTKAAPAAKAVAPEKRRIGRVINGYSNYLAMLVADAAVAAEYRGPSTESAAEKKKNNTPDDFDRACKATDKKEFAIGKGKGVVVAIGGCGSAEVHRLGDAFVIPEHYTGDDDVDAEAALDRAIATHPTTKPKLIGTVEVKSGVLVLMGLLEAGPKLDPAKVARRGVVKTDCGCAIAVKPGRYDVWREEFRKEVEGPWGLMPSRVRVVPSGTKVTAGAPILDVPPVGPAHHATPSGERRLVDPKDKWVSIQSIAVADDGCTFAGENGRFGVAAWDPSGKLLWQRAIRPQKKAHYTHGVSLALAGNDLIALCKSLGELLVLDAKTGKEKRSVKVKDPRAALVAGDRLVVRSFIETPVFSYPTLKEIARLKEYANGSGIAVSKDGRWLAMHGHEWHVFDWKTLKHVRTVEPEDSPYDVAFTHDGQLVTADGKSRIEIWDPSSGKRVARIDGAEERSRKPSTCALDASTRHLALSREDGTVVVIDLKSRKTVHRFEKHLVTIPETGSTALADVAFTKDGKTLWVSAGPKDAPVGLTAYAL